MSYPRYHAKTWPLLPGPCASELLDFLARDYGLTPDASDDALASALKRAGHAVDSDLSRAARSFHRARRHEARTGMPF